VAGPDDRIRLTRVRFRAKMKLARSAAKSGLVIIEGEVGNDARSSVGVEAAARPKDGMAGRAFEVDAKPSEVGTAFADGINDSGCSDFGCCPVDKEAGCSSWLAAAGSVQRAWKDKGRYESTFFPIFGLSCPSGGSGGRWRVVSDGQSKRNTETKQGSTTVGRSNKTT
jgi:hypothetical protein